jgi:hypothetical protein
MLTQVLDIDFPALATRAIIGLKPKSVVEVSAA